MTVIRRVFDLETRTLKGKERCYVGQPNDNLSTRIEIEYNPMNALSEGWVPYIMFDMHHDDGTPFIYGPGSSPRFDGRTFEVPYEVMSRVKSQRLQWQLWLVKARVDWNGRIDELQAGGAEYLHSSIDGFAVKGGIRCRGPSDPCRPVNPCTDPSLMAWLTYFQTETLLHGVTAEHGTLDDGFTEGVSLYFPRYVENQGPEIVELRVPYLEEDGRLDVSKYLSVVHEWPSYDDLTDQDLASAQLMYRSLAQKTDMWMPIPLWDPGMRYGIGATVVCVDDDFAPNIYIAIQPSQGMDPCTEDAFWSTITEQERVVTSWNTVSHDTIPSSKLVDDEFYLKAIREWNASVSYLVGSTVVYHNNIYISIVGNNINNPPILEDKGVTALNDTYWSRVSGDVDVGNVPTSTEVFPLGEYMDSDNIHGEGNEYRVVRIGENDPQYDPLHHVYELHHPFNTYSLFVQVKRASGHREYVDCIVETPRRNTVVLRFDRTIGDSVLDSLEAIVTPGGGRDEAYVMEDFVSKEMLGVDVATLENGHVPAGQIRFGQLTSTQSPDPDMVARYVDLVTVRKEITDGDAQLRNSIDYLKNHKTARSEFGPWSKDIAYKVDAVVARAGGIYIAVQNNQNVDPETDDGTHWKGTRFNDTEISRFSAVFGMTDAFEYQIDHPLDTKDFVYAIRRVRDGRYMREADIYAVDFDTVRVVLPSDMEPEPMVLNMYGCQRTVTDLPTVGVQTVAEASDTWILDNPTGSPLFVQAFDSTGQLQYADVQQDPAGGYDPVTVGLYKEDTGTMVYAPATRTVRFSKSDLVASGSGYDLVINKTDLLGTGESGVKWYVIQGYSGTEGQLMADYAQTSETVSVGLDANYIDAASDDWEGSLVLVEGTAASIDGDTWELETGRVAGVQVFADEGLIMGDVAYADGKITILMSESVTGTVVII